MVSKMPALHPGDVRKLQAVAAPGLEHLYDVIVFPQKVGIVGWFLIFFSLIVILFRLCSYVLNADDTV